MVICVGAFLRIVSGRGARVNRPLGPYRVEQAAELLGLHPDTVRDLCDRGELRCSRTPGGHRRIDASAIDDLVKRMVQRYTPTQRRAA
jgi:excisionase family DNA binding protein